MASMACSKARINYAESEAEISDNESKVSDFVEQPIKTPKNPKQTGAAVGSSNKGQLGIAFPFMSLPPEIRNMIYRYVLVVPHKGYLPCHYIQGRHQCKTDQGTRVFCKVQASLFEVSFQVSAESTGIFYGDNVFALREKPNKARTNKLMKSGLIGFEVDFGQVQKCYITSKYENYPGRSAELFAKALNWVLPKDHNLQYLLVDCLDTILSDKTAGRYRLGLQKGNRSASEILAPYRLISGLKQVHFVCSKPSLLPLLRYLEKSMMSENSLFKKKQNFWASQREEESKYDQSEKTNARYQAPGRELCNLFRIENCYQTQPAAQPRPVI